MNKYQLKGHVEAAKGKIKEVAGTIFDNKNLEQKGRLQKVGGQVEAKLGDLKDDIDRHGRERSQLK